MTGFRKWNCFCEEVEVKGLKFSPKLFALRTRLSRAFLDAKSKVCSYIALVTSNQTDFKIFRKYHKETLIGKV